MKIAPLADVKTHFSRFVDECRKQPVVVTRNGRPAAMLVPVMDDEDLERLVLSHSVRFRRLLDEADERARSSLGLDHDTFWRRVETAEKVRGKVPRKGRRRA